MNKRTRRSSPSTGRIIFIVAVCLLALGALALLFRLYFSTVPTKAATAGNTYYVDCQAGNDSNDGKTEELAWKSLSKASSATLVPGDSLRLKRGCSWTGTLAVPWTGTQQNNIYIGPYASGAQPLISNIAAVDASGRGVPKRGIDITGSFITVEDIAVTTDQAVRDPGCQNVAKGYVLGVSLGSNTHNNTVRKVTASHMYAGVFIGEGSHHNKIIENVLKDNTMMNPVDKAANNDAGAFGVSIYGGNDNEIAYNAISGSNACSYDYGHDGSAVEVYNGSRNAVHHNKVTDSDAFTELGKDSSHASADNVFAYNTYVSANTSSIFLVTRGVGTFGPVYRTSVYNNTAYLSGTSGQGVVCSSCGTDILTMRNNIMWAEWKTIYASAPFNESNNIFWKTGGSPLLQLQGGAALSSTSQKADPRFVALAAGDLHLSSTSPAIDKGSSEAVTKGYTLDLGGGAVPAGQAPDIGAYEYGTSAVTPTPPATGSVTLVGAGDAGRCNDSHDNATAKLVTDIISSKPAGQVRVYYGGDVYEKGTQYEMDHCYGGAEYGNPGWGSFKDITWPIIGDHEQQSDNGSRATAGYYYYNYWGYPASGPHPLGLGERYKGWYSKDFGAWHLIFLDLTNTNCTLVACGVDSEQYKWFRSDLEKNDASGERPTIVIMHHTYWKVSSATGRVLYAPFVDLMYSHGAEVLIQHDSHHFEAFNPMKPDSTLDPAFGIRAFITGFGGAPVGSTAIAMSQDRIAHTNFVDYGVLEFTLSPTSYSWKMHTVSGKDSWSGSSPIHGRPGTTPTRPPSITQTPAATLTMTRTPTPTPTRAQTATSTPSMSCSMKAQGDADCNGVVDISDFEQFRKEFTGTAATTNADFNADGQVAIDDFEVWRRGYFPS